MSNISYIHQYTEFLRCIIRQERRHPFPLRFPITPSQRASIHQLVGLLEDADTPMDILIPAFQNVNWELISARSSDAWHNIHQFYFALLALRMDGTYAPAADLTPHLAKLAYYIKYTCMYEALQKHVSEAVRCVLLFLPFFLQASDSDPTSAGSNASTTMSSHARHQAQAAAINGFLTLKGSSAAVYTQKFDLRTATSQMTRRPTL